MDKIWKNGIGIDKWCWMASDDFWCQSWPYSSCCQIVFFFVSLNSILFIVRFLQTSVQSCCTCNSAWSVPTWWTFATLRSSEVAGLSRKCPTVARLLLEKVHNRADCSDSLAYVQSFRSWESAESSFWRACPATHPAVEKWLSLKNSNVENQLQLRGSSHVITGPVSCHASNQPGRCVCIPTAWRLCGPGLAKHQKTSCPSQPWRRALGLS